MSGGGELMPILHWPETHVNGANTTRPRQLVGKRECNDLYVADICLINAHWAQRTS